MGLGILRWCQRNMTVCSSCTILIHYFILQAGVFMGFSITSALFGGTIIIAYTITIAYARYSYYYYYYKSVYDPTNGSTSFKMYRHQRYSYDAKMGLAAVILLLGVIEVVTGIWVSVCLCMMKPCCTDSQVSFLFS